MADPEIDPELKAIGILNQVLAPLDPRARRRILAYASQRYCEVVDERFERDSEETSPGSEPVSNIKSRRPVKTKSPRAHLQSASDPTKAPDPGVGRGTTPSPKFIEFIRSAGVPENRLEELIDVETGDVHARASGRSGAEKVRELAALVSVIHLWRDGDFVIPQADLAKVAKSYSVYDADSTSTYLRRATWGGSPVFFREKGAGGWRVTMPGREFVAQTIRVALGLSVAAPAERKSN